MTPPAAVPERQPPPLPALVALGLAEDPCERRTDEQTIRLSHVAALWPLGLVAQLAAFGCLLAAALHGPAAGLLLPVVAAGIAALAAGGAAHAALALPRLVARPPHLRARVLAAAVGVLGGAVLAETWLASLLPEGSLALGGLVAASGAIGIAGVTLHPVRGATLAFGAGIALMLAILSRDAVAALAALLALGGLAAVTLRLARLDERRVMRRAEEASEGRAAQRMIAEFEEQGTGWFWQTDRDGILTYLSPRVAADLVQRGREPVGRSLVELLRMDSATPGTERTLAFHLASHTAFADYSVCAASGLAERWWSISGRPAIDGHGRFQGFIGSGADLTEKRRSEAEIKRLALFDGLTGLANRQHMRLSLDRMLATPAPAFRPSGLFLLDLDRFKAVNDTLGHQAGDALLKQVAQRLQRGVGEKGLCGRLGGDEFEVLLPGLDDRDALSALARDVIGSLSQPYTVGGISVSIGCSIGVALAPADGADAETLTRNADLALYAAKGEGRGVHRFYAPAMLAGAQSRKQLEDDMRTALGEGGFHLAYQPVVATHDARIVGYEALLRWDHPTRGAISPADFVPVAEECGLIEPLGEWVLRTACAEAARWPRSVRVAVNVSPIQFANPALPALVASALANAGLAPERLELEITEGVFLDETQSSEQMFAALKGLGVRLALDDFGTGYSSLGYLRTAPFDKIKIDQSFVRGAAQPGNRNAAIIKAIVTLADTLSMETTAEGVEVQDEIEVVRELGCSHIQGYVYGRPVPTADVAAQLAATPEAKPSGHRISRAPRTRMLRSARLAIGDQQGDVRIRDISTSGAMIDGIEIEGGAVGFDVFIELLEDQMFAARVAWARDGKAGLAFAESFNLDRMNQPPALRPARRSA